MGCCGGPRSKIGGPPESIEVEKAQGGKVRMPCCRLKFKKWKSVPVASLLGAEKGPPGKPRAEESRVENAAGRRPTCPANNQILKAEAGSSGGSSRASAVFQHPRRRFFCAGQKQRDPAERSGSLLWTPERLKVPNLAGGRRSNNAAGCWRFHRDRTLLRGGPATIAIIPSSRDRMSPI
jgi:hypothetical protein